MPTQKLHVLDLDGVSSPDCPNDPRDRIWMAAPIERSAGIIDIHALERGGESI
jgi:hypothetical protein